MLPTIDFTQQLAQLQAQLQNMNQPAAYTPPVQTPTQVTDPTACAFRLPCGLCSKTNTFCGLQSEVKTDE